MRCCCCFFISSLLGVLRDKKRGHGRLCRCAVVAVASRDYGLWVLCRLSLLVFFFRFISFSFYFFSLAFVRVFLAFSVLLIYLLRACERTCAYACCLRARACAWHTMCLRAWLVLVLRFFAFYYLLFLFMCCIQGTFRYVKAFDGDTWKWYVSSESI